MEFVKESISGEIEILANDHYVAVPVTLDFTSVTDTKNGEKVVKSGTPIKSGSAGWVVSNDGNATRILYGDVYISRPIGSALVHGFVDKAKAEAASGLTYSGSINIPQIAIL